MSQVIRQEKAQVLLLGEEVQGVFRGGAKETSARFWDGFGRRRRHQGNPSLGDGDSEV